MTYFILLSWNSLINAKDWSLVNFFFCFASFACPLSNVNNKTRECMHTRLRHTRRKREQDSKQYIWLLSFVSGWHFLTLFIRFCTAILHSIQDSVCINWSKVFYGNFIQQYLLRLFCRLNVDISRDGAGKAWEKQRQTDGQLQWQK